MPTSRDLGAKHYDTGRERRKAEERERSDSFQRALGEPPREPDPKPPEPEPEPSKEADR